MKIEKSFVIRVKRSLKGKGYIHLKDLSYLSIGMTKYHDQVNLQKEELLGLTVSEIVHDVAGCLAAGR